LTAFVRDERPHQRVRLASGSPIHVLVGTDEALDELVASPRVHDDPPRARAALARRPDRPEQDRREHEVQVRVRRHDDRVVPAELEDRPAEPLADHLPTRSPSRARAGERDERDAAVVEHTLADRGALAHHEREDGWITSFAAQTFSAIFVTAIA
jgi:hypothetical protein